MDEKKIKFGFGTDQNSCETDTFDTVEDLLEHAQELWDNDRAPFDGDKEDIIYVGTAETFTVSDFAPSLDDIADIITDRFYSEHPVDEYADAQISSQKEAEEAWKAFVEKYFELPGNISVTCSWLGAYNLREHKWWLKYDVKNKFDKYVKE